MRLAGKKIEVGTCNDVVPIHYQIAFGHYRYRC